MSVVLRLTMQDAYIIYNGNQNKVIIPQLDRPTQPNEEPNIDVTNLDFINEPNDVRPASTPQFTDIDVDLIMDLDFFYNYAKVTNQNVGEFNIRTSCTLDDVRKEVLGLRDRRQGEDAITLKYSFAILLHKSESLTGNHWAYQEKYIQETLQNADILIAMAKLAEDLK